MTVQKFLHYLKLVRKECILKEMLSLLNNDDRIMTRHLSLIYAFVQLADKGFDQAIYISRRSVMKLTKIKSIVTCQKTMRELQEYGYISYRPSYHSVFERNKLKLERQFKLKKEPI